MATTYEDCDKIDASVRDVLKSVLAQYYSDLTEVGVTFALLFARTSEEHEAAVKLHGYPCAATIRRTSLKDRAKGVPDVEIVIDELQWQSLTNAEKRALLDHELYHLEISLDEDNQIEFDDLARPKLKMRLHDAQLGIFKTIIARHGRDALDTQIARGFIDEYQKLVSIDMPATAANEEASDGE